MRGLRSMIGLLGNADARVLVDAGTCSPGPYDDAVAGPMKASCPAVLPSLALELLRCHITIVPSWSDCLTFWFV